MQSYSNVILIDIHLPIGTSAIYFRQIALQEAGAQRVFTMVCRLFLVSNTDRILKQDIKLYICTIATVQIDGKCFISFKWDIWNFIKSNICVWFNITCTSGPKFKQRETATVICMAYFKKFLALSNHTINLKICIKTGTKKTRVTR